MSTSDKFGGLSWLSWIWDLSPIAAALVVIAVDFGVICLLMCLEGLPPWQRHLYDTFKWNDTIFIPLFVAMAVVQMRHSPALHGFYTAQAWHISVLAAGLIVSLFLEYGAVKAGTFTMNQEFSPSKLWHRFIFVVVFYWMGSVAIPILVAHRPLWAFILALVAFVGFGWMCYRDAVQPPPNNAHLQGSYLPWNWQVRES